MVCRRSRPLATGNLPIVLSELGGTGGVIDATRLIGDHALSAVAAEEAAQRHHRARPGGSAGRAGCTPPRPRAPCAEASGRARHRPRRRIGTPEGEWVVVVAAGGGAVGDVESTLRGIVARQLDIDPDSVTVSSDFVTDLGADSLDLAAMITAIEDEFGIPVPDEDAEEFATFGDAVQYVESRTR